MMESARHVVQFAGAYAGECELTWGQRQMWEAMNNTAPTNQVHNLGTVLKGASPCSLDSVADSIRLLVERHESLRTFYHQTSDNQPRQSIVAQGNLPLDIYSARPEGVEKLISDVQAKQTAVPFTPFELPLRLGVISVDGMVVAIALCAFHVALDGYSLSIVGDELELGLTAEGRKLLADAGTVLQPRHQALHEQSAVGMRRRSSAERYLRDRYLKFPSTRFPVDLLPEESPRYPSLVVESRAAGAAAQIIAKRCKATPVAVMMAVFSVVVSALSRVNSATFSTMFLNRLTPQAMRAVGNFAQPVPLVIQLSDENAGFDEIVRLALEASTVAYRNAAYDSVRKDDILADVRTLSGAETDFNCYINFHKWGDSSASEAVGEEDVETYRSDTKIWSDGGDEVWHDEIFYMEVIESTSYRIRLRADSRVVPSRDLNQVGCTVEAILIRAAHDGTTPLRDLKHMVDSGLTNPPLVSLDRIGDHWVDLGDVSKMVQEALAPAITQVMISYADGVPRVVAYIASSDPAMSPEYAHSCCLGVLSGRRFVITPSWYVICDRPPTEIDDEMSWTSVEIVKEGSGRPGIAPGLAAMAASQGRVDLDPDSSRA